MASYTSQPSEASEPMPSSLRSGTRTNKSNAKLLNRFYEPLQLLSMLNADRGPGEVDFPSVPQSRRFRLTWRRFLDELAWLCDHKHAGETVSAVAAQDAPEGTTFWLVSKYRASFDHLKWVLTELDTAQEETVEGQTTLDLRIATRSIRFSKDKVNNYRKFLECALKKARDVQPGSEHPEASIQRECLIDEVKALIEIKDDPLALCRAAKNFKQWRTLARLLRADSSQEQQSPWASLWHFVGRLGCWFGKCKFLALTARQFPQLLENARCEFLPLPAERKLPVDKSTGDLARALKRMLPAHQQSLAPLLYDQLEGMRLFSVADAFSENLTSERLTGRVHAEVFLLEHFHFNRFRFQSREKYIGCSKRSCYCCSLYFRFHPGNVVVRPAHNNIYVSWIPPLIDTLDEERNRRHNLDIMNQMNAYMRRDIKEEIEERFPRREKAPDSTSGVEVFSFLTQ